jgi:UDP-glucose 4-epimerase
LAIRAEAPSYVADYGNEQFIAKLISEHRVDTIFHFAGSTVVPASIADPLSYYLNNTVKSRALIAAAIAQNVAYFVFSSTAAVYGESSASPISEGAPLVPLSPYGSSKLMTEIMVRDASRAYGIRYAILRYFNVAGADADGRSGQTTPAATHLIKVACETALGKRRALDIYGTDYPTRDGTCVRDYVHVTDVARAHIAALEHLKNGKPSLIANCGYGRGYSVFEVVAAVKRISGTSFPVRLAPRRPGDPAELVARVDRLTNELGWEPKFNSLDAIVAHALLWERKLLKDSHTTREAHSQVAA